jgi:hypothetical protein
VRLTETTDIYIYIYIYIYHGIYIYIYIWREGKGEGEREGGNENVYSCSDGGVLKTPIMCVHVIVYDCGLRLVSSSLGIGNWSFS